MTRYEKEKILLMALGLSEGDKITFTDYNSGVNEKLVFEIRFDKIGDNFKLYPYNDGVRGWLYITDLIKYDFKKVEVLGNKNCFETRCIDCPFHHRPFTCVFIKVSPTTSLYGRLEYFKDKLGDVTYFTIKNALDKEVENAKED